MFKLSQDNDNDSTSSDLGAVVLEKEPEVREPPSYQVVLINDDFTPMEFVVWTLQAYFNKSEVDANSTMMEIHKLGAAIAGIYDYQIAEQKVHEVMELAKENDYPLKITGEPEDV